MSDIFKDLVVLELASVLAGPGVGMFMAELGARVIKVEHFARGGDVTRTWKSPEEGPGDRSAYFTSVNWGKESVGIDLRETAGKEIVYDLVRLADVVVASYKPGDAEKLGMDAKTLRAINPALIYADLTAYGPNDSRVGFDAIIQAESGFTFMNGTEESGPVKMPVALMDLLAAHQLKEGILIALYRRLQSGEGSHVRTSLIKSGIASLANQATNWLVAGKIPQRIGSEHPNIVPYGTIYPTSQGQGIVLAIGNNRQFGQLCKCLGILEVASDERFAENPARVRNREVLNALLSSKIAKFERDELLGILQSAQVPAGAVRNMKEVFELPQGKEMMMEADGLKGLRTVALEGENERALSAPPVLGNATERVLRDFLGYREEELARLKTNSVISG